MPDSGLSMLVLVLSVEYLTLILKGWLWEPIWFPDLVLLNPFISMPRAHTVFLPPIQLSNSLGVFLKSQVIKCKYYYSLIRKEAILEKKIEIQAWHLLINLKIFLKDFFLCLEILVLRKILGMMQYSRHFHCGEYVSRMQNMALLLFGGKCFGIRCEY